MINEAYNIDCVEYMKTMPDKYFDLAVVDPPYGHDCISWGGGRGSIVDSMVCLTDIKDK